MKKFWSWAVLLLVVFVLGSTGRAVAATKMQTYFRNGDQFAIWEDDGPTLKSSALYPVPRDWRFVGAFDPKNDGHAVICWQSCVRGTFAFWQMESVKINKGITIQYALGGSDYWKAVEVVYIGGDKNSWKVIWESIDGYRAVWDMEDSTLKSSYLFYPSKIDPSWAIVGATKGGLADPLNSKETLDITVSGNQMTLIPPTEDGYLVNVVEDGKPAYAKLENVFATYWNGETSEWYPDGGVKGEFSAIKVTLTVPTHERKGLVCFLAKDEEGKTRVLWANIKFVTAHGGVTLDTVNGLISY